MKKLYTCIIVAIATSVFVVSFLIGRATVLKDSKSAEKKDIYTGTVVIPKSQNESISTTVEAENVPVGEETEEHLPYLDVSVPDRMIFPCGEFVQKDYSQTAVYSETMGDWRAHTGIDYASQEGEAVLCVYDGTVIKVFKDKLWGNCVEINHGNNLKSVYRNLDSDINVKKGMQVYEGQVIGFVGRSAQIESAEPPHLHFEMWQDNLTINPSAYVY